jgi:hypothetical protein
MHGLSDLNSATSELRWVQITSAHIYYYNRHLMGQTNAAGPRVAALRGELDHYYAAVQARIPLPDVGLPFQAIRASYFASKFH